MPRPCLALRVPSASTKQPCVSEDEKSPLSPRQSDDAPTAIELEHFYEDRNSNTPNTLFAPAYSAYHTPTVLSDDYTILPDFAMQLTLLPC